MTHDVSVTHVDVTQVHVTARNVTLLHVSARNVTTMLPKFGAFVAGRPREGDKSREERLRKVKFREISCTECYRVEYRLITLPSSDCACCDRRAPSVQTMNQFLSISFCGSNSMDHIL